MKRKITITFSDEMAEILLYLSAVFHKPQNEILENAFWEWWGKQDYELKDKIKKMVDASCEIRKFIK